MKQLFAFLSIVFFINACTKSNNNACEARLINDCVHTEEYNPVCGCNGVTYSNAGEANCNSINDFTLGTCKGDLTGKWNFLGFASEGAQIGLDKKFHPYDIDINFNGRIGRKPYVWGNGSLKYYNSTLRQYIYKT